MRPPAAFREDVLLAQEAFVDAMKDLDPDKLVFLDESGFETNLVEENQREIPVTEHGFKVRLKAWGTATVRVIQ